MIDLDFVKRVLNLLKCEFRETISVSIIEAVGSNHKDFKISEIRQSALMGWGYLLTSAIDFSASPTLQ